MPLTFFITGVGVVRDTLCIVGTAQVAHVVVNQTGKGVIKAHADFLPDPDEPRNVDPDNYPDGISNSVMLLCNGTRQKYPTVSDSFQFLGRSSSYVARSSAFNFAFVR